MDSSGQYLMKVLHTQRVMNPCLALWGSKGVSTGVALRQRVQQCLHILQVSRIKSFGEPAVDRREQLVGLTAFALLLPQPAQARGGAQFPRLGLLVAGESSPSPYCRPTPTRCAGFAGFGDGPG